MQSKYIIHNMLNKRCSHNLPASCQAVLVIILVCFLNTTLALSSSSRHDVDASYTNPNSVSVSFSSFSHNNITPASLTTSYPDLMNIANQDEQLPFYHSNLTSTDKNEKSSGFPQWIIGFLLSFLGCTLSNLGVNMQKYAHNRLAKRVETNGSETKLVSDPMWILGLLAIAVGSVGDLVSFSFASMSLLAPLGAMTLVVNMFVAPLFLKEALSRRDILVTMIILFGTILSVVFGSKEETKYTLKELVSLYGQPLFIGYAVVIIVYIGGMVMYLRKLEQKDKPTSIDSEEENTIELTSIGGVSSSRSHLITGTTSSELPQDLESTESTNGASQLAPKRLLGRIGAKSSYKHQKLDDDGDDNGSHGKGNDNNGDDDINSGLGKGTVVQLSPPSSDSASSYASSTSIGKPEETYAVNARDSPTSRSELVEHTLHPDMFSDPEFQDNEQVQSQVSSSTSLRVDEFANPNSQPNGSRLTPAETALRAFAYPSLAGVFGAHSVLFAKSASEPVKATIDGKNQFNNPLAYLFILFLIIMVYLQMRFLNAGLSKADALYIVPVYQVCWVVMNAVVGMTYFRDYRHMGGEAMFLFLLGIAITSFGVYLLSKRNIAPVHTKLESEGELEEGQSDTLAQGSSRYAPALESVNEEDKEDASESRTVQELTISPTRPSPRVGPRVSVVSRAGQNSSPDSSARESPVVHRRFPSNAPSHQEGVRSRTGSITSSTPPVQSRGRVMSIGAFHQIYLGDATDEALPTIALTVPTFETTTPMNTDDDDVLGGNDNPASGRSSSIGGFFSSIFGGIVGGGNNEDNSAESPKEDPEDIVKSEYSTIPLSPNDVSSSGHVELATIDIQKPTDKADARKMGLGVAMTESISDDEGSYAPKSWINSESDDG